MFCNFCKKFENSKWPPYLARQNFFENWDRYFSEVPYGSKISSKSLYLARFSRYKHFCFLQFFAKISKIQNRRHIWRDKNFLKIGIDSLERYPVGQKFRRNCSISLRFPDKCVFTFSAFKKIATFSKSLISWPFCIGSFPKVNDFQTSI